MSEKVFYDDGTNKVTDKRFVVGNETYAIANITSVKIEEVDYEPDYKQEAYERPRTEEEIKQWKKEWKEKDSWTGRLILALIGTWIINFFVYIYNGGLSIGNHTATGLSEFMFWAVFIGLAIVLFTWTPKPPETLIEFREYLRNEGYTKYYLKINTAAGETQALSSTDGAAIKQVADAINNAIIACS